VKTRDKGMNDVWRFFLKAEASLLVRSAQADRKAQDMFPAHYHMNMLRKLSKLFRLIVTIT
jgi:hypothetical protein